jgi:PPE-repeat protein
MNSTFALVCLGLITLGLWLGLAALFVALLQLRRALEAVEVLVYRLTQSVEKMQTVGAQINAFAGNMRSGWVRAFELALAAVQTLWTREPASETPSHRTDKG